MNKLCVIGDPVEHSLSPLIQNAMIAAAGLPCVYGAVRVPGEETELWLCRARREGYTGFNATMPHKRTLAGLVDVLSPDGERFHAVNTVCIKTDKIYGYNTDGDGILRALEESGMSPGGRSVLVLGAGGAARAVVPKLLDAGAQRVYVANRTPERAAGLCSLVGDGRVSPADFSPETLKRLAGKCSLAVNCTSLGMTGTGGEFEDLSFLEQLKGDAGVFDLIYSPPETALLAHARQLGLRGENGLGMLIWQAVFALELFVDERLDEPAMAAAARRALEGKV